MRLTGAQIITKALENIGVKYTFGIPGVHNTELYDELNKSEQIRPILVTHEGNGSFMADAMSRLSNSIGCMVIVPAAGLTHAMSGIGEAFLDGIPMIVIAGSFRRDTGRKFQLHQMDMHQLLDGITKKTYLIENHNQIVSTIYDAYHTAVSGFPGPVFIEVPVEIQLFKGDLDSFPDFHFQANTPKPDEQLIEQAIELLSTAKNPGIFAGWGAKEATDLLIKIAEHFGAPVCTTLQGLSVFPATHALHTGMGFSKTAAVPAAANAFENCDCLLAVGVSFAEIPTGSYGVKVPENLIHMDINPDAIDANYPAKIGIVADAKEALAVFCEKMNRVEAKSFENKAKLIAADKKSYREEWMSHDSGERVNPAKFFESLRKQLDDDAITVVDDGNHTFLFAELFPVIQPKTYISPTDFNCMGYAVPGAISTQLAFPAKQVVAVVGDGAFMMTCMELVTATANHLYPIIFVFHDGELSQISQGQEIPYSRKTCTKLGDVNIEGVALATGAYYLEMKDNDDIEPIIARALEKSNEGQAVVVDINIDYSKRTRFTQGVVKTNLSRFPITEKIRFMSRALIRKVTG